MPAAASKRPIYALIAILALATLSILLATRGLSFWFDEWDVILHRRGMTADSLLRGHNGHLSLIPVLYYKALLATVGLDHYGVFKAGGLIAHAVAATLVYVLARRRVGPWWALVPVALIAFLGAAWEDLAWAFQIGFVGSVAAGVAALVALDRDTRRADAFAALALLFGLACSSQGIPFVVIAAVELAVQRQWSRGARVLVLPVTLYGLWYLGYGGEGELRLANLDAVPSFAFQMLANASEGVVGLSHTGVGTAIAAIAVAALIAVAAGGRWTPRASGLVAGLGALLALTALARAQYGEPGASRYIYPVVVIGLLLLTELLPLRVAATVPSARSGAVVAFVLLIVALGGRHELMAGASALRANQQTVSGELAALRLIRGTLPPDYRPDPNLAPQVTIGPYLAAANDFDAPKTSVSGLARLSALKRAAADKLLLQLRGPQGRPVAVPTAGCRRLAADAVLPLGAGGVTLVAPKGQVAEVRYRRFADAFPEQPSASVGGGALRVTPVADGITVPWQIGIQGATGVRACAR